MTIKFDASGKVDRMLCARDFVGPDDLADALDDCVAALRQIETLSHEYVGSGWARAALRKIGAEPSDDPICMSCGQRKPKCGVGC